jgi:L-ascorbate metabolism protein UlaG (beta-lactamase superfamily)
MPDLRLTYVGGPTLLLEADGVRLLTDPTFDPAGTSYPTPVYVLRKLQSPAVSADAVGPIDAVLLSHDHHFDNLDHAGRDLLGRAREVITTAAGAARLGGNARGLAAWESLELATPGGRPIRVTGTPARHGPAGVDRGPVTGFVLEFPGAPGRAVYLSGDTVWYEGVAAVAERFPVALAILFLGAARVKEVGPANLTFTAAEAVHAARAFAPATIVPIHFEGWAHFAESRVEVEAAFGAAGLEGRLRWLEPGRPTALALRDGRR